MDKQISRQFFNERADDWDETPRSNAPQQLEAMIARLDLREGSRVLDVGTGTGVFIPYIKQKIGSKGYVACVDFALNMLLIAVQKDRNRCMLPVCAEIETAGFKLSVFDAVICYSTFPHFHDKPVALSNIHALLKESGKVFICHTASREHINSIHLNIPDFHDHLIPKYDEMFSLLQGADFRKILIEEGADAYLAVGQK